MRAGLYRPVHVKTLRSQKLRMLLTHGKLLQSNAIAIENDLRASLRNFGLKVGTLSARTAGGDQGWRPFRCYFNCATAPPALDTNPDQALSFKRSQVSGQCRPIHAHEFGECGNRNDIIASKGDQDGKLRCAKSGGS
jgi:transposase